MNNLPNNSKENLIKEDEDTIDIKKILNQLLEKWHWFIISALICILISFLYYKYTAPTYQINARVLVNDDAKGGGVAKQAGALMDLGGIIGAKNSVDNEVEILKTRFLMEQVVRKMQLNIIYYKKINLVNRELYHAPFRLTLVSGLDTIQTSKINIKISSNGQLDINSSNFKGAVIWGQVFVLKGVGKIKIDKTFTTATPQDDYSVIISSIDERVASLMKQLSVGLSNKQVSIIDLGLDYPVAQKGEDILNALINQYINANLSDKNAIADSTGKFIRERLSLIASELGDVENKVELLKNKNQEWLKPAPIIIQN